MKLGCTGWSCAGDNFVAWMVHCMVLHNGCSHILLSCGSGIFTFLQYITMSIKKNKNVHSVGVLEKNHRHTHCTRGNNYFRYSFFIFHNYTSSWRKPMRYRSNALTRCKCTTPLSSRPRYSWNVRELRMKSEEYTCDVRRVVSERLCDAFLGGLFVATLRSFLLTFITVVIIAAASASSFA